jgi:hypothetical protein
MAAGTIRRLMLALCLLTVLASLAGSLQAQPAGGKPEASQATAGQPAANQQTTAAGGDSGAAPFDFRRILTRFEFWLSFLILGFGCVVVGVEFALLRKKDFDGNDILKVFGVTLIVVGTLFLIAAGFGDKQIAPAMGLFGTLAGYLLGRATAAKKKEDAD